MAISLQKTNNKIILDKKKLVIEYFAIINQLKYALYSLFKFNI